MPLLSCCSIISPVSSSIIALGPRPTSDTYPSRSLQRNLSGFLASTICTMRWDRSMTRHSCLQTWMFRSYGVKSRCWPSASLDETMIVSYAAVLWLALYSLSKPSPPVKIVFSLILFQLISRRLGGPCGSSRYTQRCPVLVLLVVDVSLFVDREKESILLLTRGD